MKALIFAAGLGTRLKPLTDTMPKALVPVGGKPLLDRVITKLIAAGYDDIVIKEGDLVALLYAERHEAGGNPVRRLPCLFLGYLFPYPVDLLTKIDVIGKLVGVLFDEIYDRRPIFVHIDKKQRLYFPPSC